MGARTPGLTLVVWLCLAAAEAGPQEPPAAFPVGVAQVVVDVVVLDTDGQPVPDLSEEEIEVYEDGVRQLTTFFRFSDSRVPPIDAAAPGPSAPSRVSSNAPEAEMPGRTYAIVFDDVHLTDVTAGRARSAVAEFLSSHTREGDQVTLVAPGAGVWWNARMSEGREDLLEMVDRLEGLFEPDTRPDRLSDYEAMRVHLYQDSEVIEDIQRRYRQRGFGTASQEAQRLGSGSAAASRTGLAVLNPPQDPYILAKAARSYTGVTARNEATLGAIERALNSLVRRQGRKSLILVSEGLINDETLPGFRRIVVASLRANAALYFLSARGLQGVRRADEDDQMAARDLYFKVGRDSAFNRELELGGGSVALARDTGGFATGDTDDLSESLSRIAQETRAYYLIGYSPTNRRRNGAFRKIRVETPGRGDLTIRARRGYYSPSGGAVATRPPENALLQEAMDSPYPVGDIGLRMTHFLSRQADADRVTATLVAEVDVRDLGFDRQGGEDLGSLRFAMVALDRATGQHQRNDQRVDLSLPPDIRAELGRTWLPIVGAFELDPGRHRAKVVLEDAATGRVGSVIHDFEIPATEAHRLRVSTPVLSDTRLPSDAGSDGVQLALMARREFTPEATLFCQFEVYGATRLASSGLARVSAAFEVRRSDGVLYTRGPRSLIGPTAEGRVAHTVGFPLKAATPDDYAIVVHIEDELSGRTLDVREAFHVSAQASTEDTPAKAP